MDYGKLTYSKLIGLIDWTADQAAAKRFYHGDHWQGGAGYSGPRPAATDAAYTRVMAEIAAGFVADDATAEVVNRHAGGVVARNVAIGAGPKRRIRMSAAGPDSARAAEAQALIEQWFALRDVQEEIYNATAAALYSGRGPLRVFIPAGERDEDGRIPADPIEAQIGRIFAEAVDPDVATVYTSKATKKPAGIYHYVEETADDDPDRPDNKNRVELSYREAGDLVIRILATGSAAAEEAPEYRIPVAGDALPMYQIERRPLITPAVMSQQKSLNLSHTMKDRNTVAGGFLERTLLNAQLPGTYDPETQKYTPDPLSFGAGRVNNFAGMEYTDADGNQRVVPASIVYREPSDPAVFIAAADAAYNVILRNCNQLHYAAAGDGAISGESRRTAMAAYVVDLLTTKQRVDGAARWLARYVLDLAAALAGVPDYFAGVKITADAMVDPGPIDSDMMRTVADLVAAQLLDRETAMRWIGIEDPAAVLQKIQEENAGGLAAEIAEFQRLIDTGADTGQPDAEPATEGA